MAYLLLGKISKPHGLKGEVKVFSHTDFAFLRYQKGKLVYYLDNNEYKPLEINSFFKQGKFDVVSFKGYLDIKLIDPLLNKELYIKKEDAKLPDGYYHYTDLVNCNIMSDNKVIGIVKEVMDFPANYCLRCETPNHQSFDIPFVDEFIQEVNIKDKCIKVKLIEGIL